MCPNDQPIKFELTRGSCEVELFKIPSSLPSICQTKTLLGKPTVWQRLLRENSWVYFVEDTTVTIPCEGVPQPIRLPIEGAGKISIAPNCKIYIEHSLLLPSRTYKSSLLTDFFPVIPIVITDGTHGSTQLEQIKLESSQTHYNFKNLVKDSKDLKIIQNKLKLISQSEKDKGHFTTVLVECMIILMTIIAFCILIMYLQLKFKKHTLHKIDCKPQGDETPTLQPISFQSKGTGTENPLPAII